MAGFYYFLPGVRNTEVVLGSRVRREALELFGLEDVFGEDTQAAVQVLVQDLDSGPNNGPGTSLYLRPHSELSVPQGYGFFQPEQQKWVEWYYQFREKFWIGYDLGEDDRCPTPGNLMRKPLMAHFALPDNQGNDWVVPVINPASGKLSMPTEFVFKPGGHINRVPSARFQSLWDLSGEIFDQLMMENRDKPSDWFVEAAIRILQVNYRIDQAELAMLQSGRDIRFLDDRMVEQILILAVDQDLIVELQKKSQLAESSSSLPGQEDGTTATDPAEQPCTA